jgi:nitroreductase/dihydropteridine reductase
VNLNELTETGHFTKVFNPTRRIPGETFDVLLKFIYSCVRECTEFSLHSCSES